MDKSLRKAVIAGNWKMKKTPDEAKAIINEMKPLVADADCDVVLCVPYIDIFAAQDAAAGSNIKIVGKQGGNGIANGTITIGDGAGSAGSVSIENLYITNFNKNAIVIDLCDFVGLKLIKLVALIENDL